MWRHYLVGEMTQCGSTMCANDSVQSWLEDLRYSIDNYDYFDRSRSPDRSDSDPDPDPDDMDVVPERSGAGDYLNLWECEVRGCADLKLNFAEESRVSYYFCDSLEELDVFPVIIENFKFEHTEDIMYWKSMLRYSYVGEDDSIMETEVIFIFRGTVLFLFTQFEYYNNV